MKLLLTGANGFVGSALCQRFLTEKNTVVAPTRSSISLPNHELLQAAKITGLQDDIDWTEYLDNIEVVIHLASRVHVMNEISENPTAEFRKINVDATLNLARQAASNGVSRFIYISSIKVNGEETFPNQPFKADDIPSPVDSYGVSKFEAEMGLLKITKNTEMEIVIIRPPLVYGPGVKANFQKIMSLLSKGIPLPFGSINNKRSLVSLDNLVDFIVHCTSHPRAANQIFLVSDGKDLSMTELLKLLGKHIGASVRLVPIPVYIVKLFLKLIGKENISLRVCGWLQVDITKNRDLLGWEPNGDINMSFKKTVEDFLA